MISYFSVCFVSDMVTESSWVIFVLFLETNTSHCGK